MALHALRVVRVAPSFLCAPWRALAVEALPHFTFFSFFYALRPECCCASDAALCACACWATWVSIRAVPRSLRDLELAEYLLSKGADPNREEEYLNTPIIIAVTCCQVSGRF